ncbi:MAG: DUF2157 domain-containing protein, partial [Candidatus Peregrinibacteria bacterium]|nr:DUF2157 domain-containing protein [Candidatus Peregrinibacteria bacterium]
MNVDEKIIGKWEKEGVVSAKQAATMRNDLAHVSAEKSSTRWVVAISTIGAILLGIAAIMFISANWQALTRHEKVGLAVLVTFGSFGMGYYLAYVRQNLPKLGNVAIFLSTILFGGTLALISQVYHLDGPPYGLFLLWTLGILPVAYAFRSRAILLLSITVMFITIVLFLGNAKGIGIEEAAAVFQNIATLILVGTLFFA